MENCPYVVQAERSGEVSINIKDNRPIAQGVSEDYRNMYHKHISISALAGFLEQLTEAFYQAGVVAGRQGVADKVHSLRESARKLVG